jgi:hypothetical protein
MIDDDTIDCIYLCGPMTGIPEFNAPAFDAAWNKYTELGYCVHSPVDYDREQGLVFEGLTGHETPEELDFDLGEALVRDATQVVYADKIVVLKGWLQSSGAQWELQLARMLGKEVIFD